MPFALGSFYASLLPLQAVAAFASVRFVLPLISLVINFAFRFSFTELRFSCKILSRSFFIGGI